MGKIKCSDCKGTGYGDISGGLELPVLCGSCGGAGHLDNMVHEITPPRKGDNITCTGCGGGFEVGQPLLIEDGKILCNRCEGSVPPNPDNVETPDGGMLPGLTHTKPWPNLKNRFFREKGADPQARIEQLELRIAKLIKERDIYRERRRNALESGEQWRELALKTKKRLVFICETIGAHPICNPTDDHYHSIIHAQIEYILGIGEFADGGFFGSKT